MLTLDWSNLATAAKLNEIHCQVRSLASSMQLNWNYCMLARIQFGWPSLERDDSRFGRLLVREQALLGIGWQQTSCGSRMGRVRDKSGLCIQGRREERSGKGMKRRRKGSLDLLCLPWSLFAKPFLANLLRFQAENWLASTLHNFSFRITNKRKWCAQNELTERCVSSGFVVVAVARDERK